MSSIKKSGSSRLFSISVFTMVVACFAATAFGQVTFPGTGAGPIPDGGVGGAQNPGTPVTVSFEVTGLSGAPTDVSVDLDATHSWVGDIVATLNAPDGTTSHILMSNTGNTSPTSFGDSSDLGGLYTFNDTATANWWDAAAATLGAVAIPLGAYKASDNSGAQTDITPSFAGLADPNGTWTLVVTDGGAGDTGTVNAASLTLTAGSGGGSEPDTDFDGDGVSDYAVVRDETPEAREGNFMNKNSLNYAAQRQAQGLIGNRRDTKVDSPIKSNNLGGPPAPGTNLVWYTANSGAPGTFNIAGLGDASVGEQITPADFDGDGNDDLAVWRGVSAAGPGGGFFFILNSSDSTVDTVDFGQNGDEAGIVGDYDGDGKADPAVFRQPGAAPFGQSFFFYKGSAGGGEITFVPWGDNTSEDIRAVRGDFDGDGMHDFVIHRTSPDDAGKGQYVILRSSDGGVEYVNYGNSTDLLFPGDIDGDGMSDFIKVRVVANNIEWYVMTRDGTRVDAFPTTWGIVGLTGFSEFAAIADYDGDGKDDIAIWRRDNADEDNCYYYILRSSDGALQTYEFGSTADVAVQTWDQQF